LGVDFYSPDSHRKTEKSLGGVKLEKTLGGVKTA